MAKYGLIGEGETARPTIGYGAGTRCGRTEGSRQPCIGRMKDAAGTHRQETEGQERVIDGD